MQLVGVDLVHVVQVHQHDVGVVARLQHALVVGQAQHGGGTGAHQEAEHFQRQTLLTAELGVADAEGRFQTHHTGSALLLLLGGVGGVVGADAGHGAVLDGVDQRGHVVRLADGRVDAVGQAAVVKPQVVRRDLAADPRAAHPAHADGVDGLPGGDVAHVQPGAVVLGQMAVAHGLDVLGQAVVPGADLAILGVGHDGQAALGGNRERAGHDGVVHDAVAVLGDELDVLGQGQQVIQRLAVEILRDGDGLVCVAQADAGGLGLDGVGDLGTGADRLRVGHQVDEGVPARGSRGGAGGDVLLVLKAGGAPVAVGVDEGGQDRAALRVEHLLPFRDEQPQTDSGDFSVAQPDLNGLARAVLCVADQHGGNLL